MYMCLCFKYLFNTQRILELLGTMSDAPKNPETGDKNTVKANALNPGEMQLLTDYLVKQLW